MVSILPFYGAIDSLSKSSGVILNMLCQNQNRERVCIARGTLSEKEWLEAFEQVAAGKVAKPSIRLE